MAGNDYYDYRSQNNGSPYHAYTNLESNILTPVPSHSLYESGKHPYSHATPAQSFSGVSNQYNDEHDLFDDGDAIPLNGRKTKHESVHTIAPILPHEQDDPFVRDIDPRKRRKLGKRAGWFGGKITWVVYILSTIQIAVFVAELIKNAILTKTPFEIHPSFNPMIGPSPYLLINFGARYQPCMHNVPNVQNSSIEIFWPCPNATATTGASVSCSLSELCGFNGVPNPHVGGSIDDRPEPNQWWRFIIPIFIHAGIIHIGFNLLLQLTLGRDIEKLIGSIRFFVLYFAAGIFGFVLGGNFAANGIASCGCSGSLFGILAITLLDLLYTWRTRTNPIRDLLFILLDVVIALVLGLLPGLDNFSHIGGFLVGLVLGVSLLRSPAAIARRTDGSYPKASYADAREQGLQGFVKEPADFFRGRQGVWWIWWLLRVVALVGVLVSFILLLKNFYIWYHECSWCKYLSCLPITVGGEDWCSIGNLDFTPTSNGTTKRSIFDLTGDMYLLVKGM